MALEPVGSQNAFPHKASADRNADASFHAEHKAQNLEAQNSHESVLQTPSQHKKTALTANPPASAATKQHGTALSAQAESPPQTSGVQETRLVKHMAPVQQAERTSSLERALNGAVPAQDGRTPDTDILAITDGKERLISVLQSYNLPVSPLAQKAVLLAMAQGLRLSPALVQKIIKLLERGASSDDLTLIQALEYNDTNLFERALVLLGALHAQHTDSSGSSGGQTSSDETGSGTVCVTSEAEEKQTIIDQLRLLISKQCTLFDASTHAGMGVQEQRTHDGVSAHHGVKNTLEQSSAQVVQKPHCTAFAHTSGSKAIMMNGKTWIHVPFSYVQGALNLTGTLRMVYNYYTKKIERIVLECTDIRGERCAVLEADKVFIWTTVEKERLSFEHEGFICLSERADIEACACCGIDSFRSRYHEKKY